MMFDESGNFTKSNNAVIHDQTKIGLRNWNDCLLVGLPVDPFAPPAKALVDFGLAEFASDICGGEWFAPVSEVVFAPLRNDMPRSAE